MSILQFPSNPPEDLDHNSEELKKLALDNLQNILYQADISIIKNWLPILCAALETGKLGETVILGYGYYAIGDHEEVRATLRSLEARFPDEHRRELINYESDLLRIRNEFTYGNFEKAFEIFNNLPKIEKYPFNRRNDYHFSKHRSNLVAAFYLHNRDEFQKHYAQISEYLTSDFGSVEHLSVNNFKAMHAFLNGNYLVANEYALAALKIASELKANGAYAPFESAYILADTYLEFGEAGKSEKIVNEYLEKAIHFNQYPWITAFYAKAAIIKLQEGNISGSLALIRKGREAVEGPLFNSTLSFLLDSHEILIRLPMGDIERINEILFRLPKSENSQILKTMMDFYRNPSSAMSVLQKLPRNTDQDKFRIEAFLALINVNNRPEALRHLQNAVDLAVPNGYFRAFLNLPAELKAYMLDIAAASPTIYLEKLSKAIRAQSSLAALNPSDSHIPLTKRELDVLRRLGTNQPITKIATSLHISNNTIKTHLKNVYRKLNVESRDEAVARGKELSLL